MDLWPSFATSKDYFSTAEFMEHDEKPLSIDVRLLAALVEKIAVHLQRLCIYKELEFEGALSKKMDVNPVAVVKAVIRINNQLHQHKSSCNIVVCALEYWHAYQFKLQLEY
uniref:Serine/threonine-protein kinase TOR n=1 Tax=Tanacetum cinerariifolium TaxID=118510 RepID=A0A699KQR7_TANCI|nr:serine/threonine-protein kinase TOR [Tanacetum cinerariifolium]